VKVLSRRFWRGPIAVRNINDAITGQPVSFHPCPECGKRGGVRFGVTLGAEGLQPVHVATELAQPEGVLKVNPEMPSNFREGGDFVAPNNHCRRFCHHFPPMEGAICSCFTPSDGALHGEHRFKVLKPSVDLREHFESHSAWSITNAIAGQRTECENHDYSAVS